MWQLFLSFDNLMTRDLLATRFSEEGINIKIETLRRGFDGITGLGPFPTEFELYVDTNQLEQARSIFKNWLDLPGKEDPIWLETTEVLQSWAEDPETYGELAAATAAKLLEINRL
jgi:hypothetical protein